MGSVRQKFAEHLLLQVGAGLRDAKWDRELRAFRGWCLREDSGQVRPEQRCCSCDHSHHDGPLGCGAPRAGGGHPYYSACMCGVPASTRESTSHELIIRDLFDWRERACVVMGDLVEGRWDDDIEKEVADLLGDKA